MGHCSVGNIGKTAAFLLGRPIQRRVHVNLIKKQVMANCDARIYYVPCRS